MSQAEPIRRHQLDANGLALSLLDLGPQDAPCVVMLHGLRDSAWSLEPVARIISAEASSSPLRVLLCELRGHGGSARSDGYAMPNFLLDLHAVIEAFTPDGAALVGHSLGGQIVSRYAALFPELSRAAIIIEGLGPPRRPHEGDAAAELAMYRHMMLTRIAHQPGQGRPIAGIEDVVQRLCRNNPRLDPEAARRIAPHLVTETASTQYPGALAWAFDPRASGVFVGVGHDEGRRFWEQVKAPTAIITGALSFEYWGREMGTEGFTGHFAPGEMEQRAALFRNSEHHWFEGSGHMVHYDEPDRLGRLCRQFLEKHYV